MFSGMPLLLQSYLQYCSFDARFAVLSGDARHKGKYSGHEHSFLPKRTFGQSLFLPGFSRRFRTAAGLQQLIEAINYKICQKKARSAKILRILDVKWLNLP